VLQPAMYLNKKVNYLNLFNFILEKFELNKENFDKYVDLYSLTNIHVCKSDTPKSYNTILTMYKGPNASEGFQGTLPTSQEYSENIIDEKIHSYYKNESIDIIQVEPQLNVTNINAATIFIVAFASVVISFGTIICYERANAQRRNRFN
jgi:hypothetical protein